MNFTNLPLPNEGGIGAKDGIVLKWETTTSLELAREVCQFWEPNTNTLWSYGTTFFLFILEVVVVFPSLMV